MECKKCKCIGTVVLRKKDYYCSQCFITNVNHKFRASIGKNKVFSSTEKVLVGLSGGLGSSVLLDLVHDGVKLNTHKILRIIPVCLHITGKMQNILISTYKLLQLNHSMCVNNILNRSCPLDDQPYLNNSLIKSNSISIKCVSVFHIF